jgi:EAL and modified HD-GYP domain-containing signal transduction protein
VDVFIARQPIFDADEVVYGYELLFRSGPENFFPDFDPDYATSHLIHDSAFVFGQQSLTFGKKVFINVTRRALLADLVWVLPSDSVVIELLETVKPDVEVIEACKALKESGYLLALDDFVAVPGYEPLIELADFLKVDFLTTEPQARRQLAERYRSHLRLIAEKVETFHLVREDLDVGYEYFQGFFFCRPEVISRRAIPSSKLAYLQFLREMSRPDLDFDELEQIIKRDPSLTVKLLRLLRSAAFGYGDRVNTVRQALIFLGERPMKKWASMIALHEIADDKPTELLMTCLARARLCELLAPPAGLTNRRHELFLVGMLSLIDAVVGHPMAELIDELGVSAGIRAGLFEDDCPLGRVRSLVVAHERADWDRLATVAADLGISESSIPSLYAEAVGWAGQVLQF